MRGVWAALLVSSLASGDVGVTVRERFELATTPGFAQGYDAYLLERVLLHGGLHLDPAWTVFGELEDVRAFGKDVIGRVDENPLDVRQLNIAFQRGPWSARIGRQDMAFDLQRFISLRDGPNVHQSFDAAWIAWDNRRWRFAAFASLPVHYEHAHPFDDTPQVDRRFGLARAVRRFGAQQLSAYYAILVDHVRTHIVDARYVATGGGLDLDAEAMGQATTTTHAGAIGIRSGYTSGPTRVGLQADAATGAFDPLFPNGFYFTYAGTTGYSNLIHVRPSFTLRTSPRASVTASIGLQWRATTDQPVFTQPRVPVAAGAGAWTGTYLNVHAELHPAPNLTLVAEVVHFQVGAAIRSAGGHDSDYLGLELKAVY